MQVGSCTKLSKPAYAIDRAYNMFNLCINLKIGKETWVLDNKLVMWESRKWLALCRNTLSINIYTKQVIKKTYYSHCITEEQNWKEEEREEQVSSKSQILTDTSLCCVTVNRTVCVFYIHLKQQLIRFQSTHSAVSFKQFKSTESSWWGWG